MTKGFLGVIGNEELFFEIWQKIRHKGWGDKGKGEKIKICKNLLTFEKKYDIIPTVAEA